MRRRSIDPGFGFVFNIYLFVGEHVLATTGVWRSENNFQPSILLIHHVGFRHGNQVIRIDSNELYSVTRLADPAY